MTQHPLDNPVWESLATTHAHLAEGSGRGRRFPADVSPFSGLADQADPAAWDDLAAVTGPGAEVLVPALTVEPPAGFAVTRPFPGVQLVATDALRTEPHPDAVELGEDDVPEVLDLVARTRPGPFGPRTVLLGRYLGVREGGRLVAMAGERLRPTGATEISAVCTDPAARGRGLATALVRAVAHGVRERGELPFLHAAAQNVRAIALYEHLGFRRRRDVDFATVRTPS
ncbi:ribosomal protein S18 acetylase RimI-like enzyme [Kineococcus radiotolerans]|uniref:Ribosomal protein S18 acetylase RimI-like enzyme n=1 Tax=Kineococcus radiotolerans TaxID=131568 RepID=A0A7W4TNW8_KINRA|nr:GNAT family N-acetyltransferase [Kineococcus radiotolerans]MBB2902347.1 ribosomal protein S18 acetylase RimI-like enzyme [Kineococcus radiotolerans]